MVEEGDEEGQEQQPAASEATVEAASAPKAARGSSRRSTAGRGGVSRRRAEPDSSAGAQCRQCSGSPGLGLRGSRIVQDCAKALQ